MKDIYYLMNKEEIDFIKCQIELLKGNLEELLEEDILPIIESKSCRMVNSSCEIYFSKDFLTNGHKPFLKP